MKIRITVNAEKQLITYADKLVKKGEYRSRSHAFDEALKLLRAKEESLLEKIRDRKL
ncbi:MAG: hypothetical protein AABX75_03185 [Nanoarchaeota archaeon]